ncbi:NAD(P)-dependent oxidoreductase [Mucilaginibacter aquaedulcis]|uniref:NAD(P)-dependent oxidoreductase n=1 Tax=Mucilaginibacter aquaedulcis TaxID=1187081 RepID=UPI0025B31F67|nr:NAD(P)-dependent oxidoreductase [Mucilaginibacter aquaedulcis]MDN3546887.1 NAD(P)-dependent oxidoreductase [Mucilaginibacter aquaedulcis]
MKLAIIGATGNIGLTTVNEALQRGHEVTAIVRDAKKLDIKNDKLTIGVADVLNVDELAAVLAGHDAIVSAFNSSWTSPTMYDDFITGSKAIQQAVKQSGVKRLLVVGGAGSLEIAPGLQLVDSPDFPPEFKTGATAARDYLNILKEENDLDWTFLSPAIYLHPDSHGPRTGKYRVGTDQPVFDEKGHSFIVIEDLAVAIIDELENNQFIKRRFTVAY